MPQRLFYLFVIAFSCTQCAGIKQRHLAKVFAKKQRDTMETPYWKAMMEDTLSNFAATVHAFDSYWKNKKKPVLDEENEGKDIYNSNKKEDEELGNLDQVFDYKRFLAWKQKNQYRVKENGLIMTEYDILQQWKKEHADTTK